MKTLPFLLALLASHFLAPSAHAIAQARANYRNVSTFQSATQNKNPGVAAFNGYIKGSQVQTGNAVLQECAFGQAFSQWYPSDTYGSTIVASVRSALYPVTTAGTSRTSIEESGKPFRYKWLLYDGAGTDVTFLNPTSFDTWFTAADRTAIATQIDILKVAIAASPLDTSLRNTLLDIYYDLAVAEMQVAKPKLVTLAKYHLGLQAITDPTKFVIDKEIDTYVEIDAAFQAAIAQFCTLLSSPFPGIDPSSFDSRVPFGTQPMGQYIFRREQSHRNSTPLQFAGTSGGVQEVPDINASNQPVARPSGQILFTGYKDLNALLQIVAQRQQHLATLCRLRGARQAVGDVALARQALIQATGSDDTDQQIIKSWFPELFPPDLNALTPEQAGYALRQQQSGVLAALSAVEAGRIQLVMVTPFLNGTTNILGYDPEFLLLAPSSQDPPQESYNVLKDMTYTEPSGGGLRPLDVALNKLNNPDPLLGARSAYNAFQEKVEKVADDLDAADTARDARWLAITGHTYSAVPGFNLKNPNPTAGSELGAINATIQGLDDQNVLRATLHTNLDLVAKEGADGALSGYAVDAVNIAEAQQQALQGLNQTYRLTTASLYDDSINAKALAAGSAAAFDAVSGAAGAASQNSIGGTIAAVVIGSTGAINTKIQYDSAKTIAQSERDIDYAGTDLTTGIESVGVPLTVNQAHQTLLAVKRERIANNLAMASDKSARGQAVAQQQALLAELARLLTQHNADVKAIRKKSYADPLHYQRAEKALIDADESFATAQRWMFYTLQALNYKWHGKFAKTVGSKSYDTSTLFKCRNANELKELLVQMVAWDSPPSGAPTSGPLFTKISLLKHILAPNPRRYNPTQPVNLSSDPGTRPDDTIAPPPTPVPTLPTLQYFRKLLATKYKEAGTGDLVIPFSTVFGNEFVDQVDGNFFRGARYNAAGVCIDQGFYREKIQKIAVNIIAENAPAPNPNIAGISGVLTYAGATYFHTRTPPRSDRTWFPATGVIDEHPGELIVSAFRYWESPTNNGNFIPRFDRIQPINIAYNPNSGFINGTGVTSEIAQFERKDFAGFSVAASGWVLRIYRTSGIGVIDAANIKDIELIITYTNSTRTFPY